MILRFTHMLAIADKADNMINRACRDLCGSSFVEFGKLKQQFYLMPNLDLFIDDDMDEECSGYILKCLRAIGFLQEKAEVVVPNKYWLENELPPECDVNEASGSENNVIVSIMDYLPDEVSNVKPETDE